MTLYITDVQSSANKISVKVTDVRLLEALILKDTRLYSYDEKCVQDYCSSVYSALKVCTYMCSCSTVKVKKSFHDNMLYTTAKINTYSVSTLHEFNLRVLCRAACSSSLFLRLAFATEITLL